MSSNFEVVYRGNNQWDVIQGKRIEYAIRRGTTINPYVIYRRNLGDLLLDGIKFKTPVEAMTYLCENYLIKVSMNEEEIKEERNTKALSELKEETSSLRKDIKHILDVLEKTATVISLQQDRIERYTKNNEDKYKKEREYFFALTDAVKKSILMGNLKPIKDLLDNEDK